METPTLEEPQEIVAYEGPSKQDRVLEGVPLARENPGEWVRIPGTARHPSGWQKVSNQLQAGELTDEPEGVWETTVRTVDFDGDVRLVALYLRYVGGET